MKRLTTVHVILDIIHDGSLKPDDVARIAGDVARDAVVWTDNEDLKRATEDIETPVTLIAATAYNSTPITAEDSSRCEFCEAVCRQVEDPDRRNPCRVHGTPWLRSGV